MSGPYKRHFACFACRKAFKQPPFEDFLAFRGIGYVYEQLEQVSFHKKTLAVREQELGHRLADLRALRQQYRNEIRLCPECGDEMIDMGLDFKPPRQSDAKAWKALHGMYRVGHVFHTCGCDGPGWIPKSKSEYDHYLDSTKKHYQAQLEFAQKSDTLPLAARGEAAGYWADRIAAIEREQGRAG